MMSQDDHRSRPRQNRTNVRVQGGKSAIFTGFGNQNVTFGSPSTQAVILVVVTAAVVFGCFWVPDASTPQTVLYCALLVMCGFVAGLSLARAYNAQEKKLRVFALLVIAAVVSGGFAMVCYLLLAGHGDLTVPVTVRGKAPLGNGDHATAVIDGPAARTHLRVRITLPDHYATDTCVTTAAVSIAPVVNGEPRPSQAVLLRDGESGDIPLHGAHQHIELDARVKADKACEMDLQYESAVLHDDEWWLP